MKKFFFILLFLPLLIQGQITFEKTIKGDTNYAGNDVIQTSDSGYAFVGREGYYYYQWYGFGIRMTKTDAFGNVTWNKLVLGAMDIDMGTSVCETDDHFLLSTSCIETAYPYIMKGCLSKTALSGDTIFLKYYSNTIFKRVRQGLDHNYYVCGSNDTNNGLVLKISQNGDLLWGKTYSGIHHFKSFTVDADSGFSLLAVPPALIKIDKNGNVIWNKTLNIPIVEDISETTGGYYVLGRNASNSEMFVFRTNNNGDTLWTKNYLLDVVPLSCKATTDGGCLIAGNGNQCGFIMKIDANGSAHWSRIIGPGTDNGSAINTTFDGGYVYCGSRTTGPETYDATLVKGIDDPNVTGITNSENTAITVYPQPASEFVTIKIDDFSAINHLTVFDMYGNQLKDEPFSGAKHSLEVSGLASGIYFLRIKTDGRIFTGKMVVR